MQLKLDRLIRDLTETHKACQYFSPMLLKKKSTLARVEMHEGTTKDINFDRGRDP